MDVQNIDLYNDLLSVREAAAMLRVRPETMDTWRHKGVGPKYLRVGKRSVRYLRQQVLDFVLGGIAA